MMKAQSYEEFLNSKLITSDPSGFEINPSSLPDCLYPYQSDLTRWSVARGKAALFTLTGTGKTLMESSYAQSIYEKTNDNVLMVAPLCVAKQTVRLSKEKLNLDINYCRHRDEVKKGINITNYEMLHRFEGCRWAGFVADESGILKNMAGKMRNYIIDYSRNIPFKLAGTATPAPNDFMEIGNHAEFLGIMSYNEMLATFFVHDGGDTSKWRLKGHARDKFWEWLASWGVFLTKPSDLGYSDEGFDLPPLYTEQHIVEAGASDGCLFPMEAKSLQDRQRARKASVTKRAEKCAEIVGKSNKPFFIWCDLNAEADLLIKIIPGAVEIRGSDSIDRKESVIMDFVDGNIPVMISKPSIFGFGLNLQVCADTAFVGLSDSFEAIFQTTKRFHRHGQKKPVTRHFIISEAEGAVLQNIKRKESDFINMIGNMVEHTKRLSMENIKQLKNEKIEYKAHQKIIFPEWLAQGVIN